MNRIIILYFASVIFQILIFTFYYRDSFPHDDAFITYRYADNLTSGIGWVYNKGELTSGATSFINTILITIISSLFGQTPEEAGRLLPLLLSLINTFLFTSLLFKLASSKIIAAFFISLYTLNPVTYKIIFSGMETNLFICSVLTIFFLVYQNKILTASIVSIALPFVRPEGALLTVVLFVYIIFNRESTKHYLVCIILLVITLPLYILINYIFFGIPVPLSMYAKYISYSDTMLIQSRYQLLKSFFFGKLGLLFIPVIIFGFIYSFKKKPGIIYLYYFAFGYILIYFIMNPWMRPWYYSVMFPFIIFLCCLGMFYLFQLLISNNIFLKLYSSYRNQIITIFFFTIFIIFGIVLLGHLKREYGNGLRSFDKSVYVIGNYLAAVDNIENKKVYTGDIGYIGYKSNGIIIDYAGLVYPKALEYSKFRSEYDEGRSLDWLKQIEFIRNENPDFIVNDNIYPFYKKMKEDKFLSENYSLIFSSGTMDLLKRNEL